MMEQNRGGGEMQLKKKIKNKVMVLKKQKRKIKKHWKLMQTPTKNASLDYSGNFFYKQK